jgi:Tfp pilus assembly protein PilE
MSIILHNFVVITLLVIGIINVVALTVYIIRYFNVAAREQADAKMRQTQIENMERRHGRRAA